MPERLNKCKCSFIMVKLKQFSWRACRINLIYFRTAKDERRLLMYIYVQNM